MIRHWARALSPEECAELAGRFAWGEHGVYDRDAQDIGRLVNERTGLSLRWRNHVTLSTKEVPWHIDSALGATLKICIYLTDGPGTEFRIGGTYGGRVGDIVAFDIALEHRTAPPAPGVGGVTPRRVLGLRGFARNDEPTRKI